MLPSSDRQQHSLFPLPRLARSLAPPAPNPKKTQPANPPGTPVVRPQDLPSRPRRNRRSPAIRDATRETWLSPAHLILPIFVHEDSDKNVPIPSMPGVSRLSYGHNVLDAVREARSYGVRQVVIFPKTPERLKTQAGEEAFNADGLAQRTIRLLKDAFAEDLEVYTDVALDPYSCDGHDGIVRDDGVVLNDETVEHLCRQAVSQAEAGADVVSPSGEERRREERGGGHGARTNTPRGVVVLFIRGFRFWARRFATTTAIPTARREHARFLVALR